MNEEGAYIDESMITGEPTPALKKRFSRVLAGTILQQGTLRLRATQVGEQTALAGMIRMVQEAQGSKAPVQRVVDKLAMIFAGGDVDSSPCIYNMVDYRWKCRLTSCLIISSLSSCHCLSLCDWFGNSDCLDGGNG